MAIQKTMDTQAITRRRICGHGLVPTAHGGRLLRGDSCFVALKIANVVPSMARTMREHAKLMLLKNIFAARTRVLIFWKTF
jgi:hypothetical protein